MRYATIGILLLAWVLLACDEKEEVSGPSGDKLAFKLQVTGVKVNNEPFELPVTTFSFDLAKAK